MPDLILHDSYRDSQAMKSDFRSNLLIKNRAEPRLMPIAIGRIKFRMTFFFGVFKDFKKLLCTG